MLAFPLVLSAQDIAGRVVDPQNGIIVAARVELTCEGKSVTSTTDARGEFSISYDFAGSSHCSLVVSQVNFVTATLHVRADSGVQRIELKMEGLTQKIDVQSPPEDVQPVFRPLNSASLSHADLLRISDNSADLLEYAKILAGATSRVDTIRVDGLASEFLPSADRIESIEVNMDPFSARYPSKEGNQIDIRTLAPDDQFHFNLRGPSLARGGRSLLRPGMRASSMTAGFGITGPVPRTPLTFSFDGSRDRRTTQQPIADASRDAISKDTGTRDSDPVSSHETDSGSFGAYYSRSENLRMNFHLTEFLGRSRNSGVGGIVLAESVSAGKLRRTESRLTFENRGAGLVQRGGITVWRRSHSSVANAESVGLRMPGVFQTGGAASSQTRGTQQGWTASGTVESSGGQRMWSAGATASYRNDETQESPNPFGILQFESPTANEEGTWFVSSGQSHVRYPSLSVAAFGEGMLLQEENFILRTGLRIERQTGTRFYAAPRISALGQAAGFVFRFNAGLFLYELPNEVFIRARRGDGSGLQDFIVRDATLEQVRKIRIEQAASIHTSLASELIRPREIAASASIQRELGPVQAGLEYTWTRGTHLLGSRRLPEGSGWLDRIESSRSLARQQLHGSLEYRARRHTLTAHYEWQRSFDSTDGPFSYAVKHDDVRAEWARTAGSARHNMSIVGNLNLPAKAWISVVTTLRSSAPHNITSGLDPLGNGLYNDRGGLLRNSGRGSAYKTVSFFGSLPLNLPLPSQKTLRLKLGAQIQNLFNTKNYLEFGSVLRAPTFGQPLGTYPGRSLQFSINLGS
jgi:hypothetical protein